MLIIPLTIFVVILSAWKNLISEGSIPVGPALILTSTGAVTPTLAGDGRVNPSIFGFKLATEACVKIIATLPLMRGTSSASYGKGFQCYFLNS